MEIIKSEKIKVLYNGYVDIRQKTLTNSCSMNMKNAETQHNARKRE